MYKSSLSPLLPLLYPSLSLSQMRDALEQEYQELLENEKPREEQADVDEDEAYWAELF